MVSLQHVAVSTVASSEMIAAFVHLGLAVLTVRSLSGKVRSNLFICAVSSACAPIAANWTDQINVCAYAYILYMHPMEVGLRSGGWGFVRV